MIFSSSTINNKFHRPYNVALFCSIGELSNDMYVFESFLSLHHFVAKSRSWMSGIRSLCAYAYYRASLFVLKIVPKIFQLTTQFIYLSLELMFERERVCWTPEKTLAGNIFSTIENLLILSFIT